MRKILDALMLLASCVLGVVAFDSPALGSEAPGNESQVRSGSGHGEPLLGGIAALGLWWLWRRSGRSSDRGKSDP